MHVALRRTSLLNQSIRKPGTSVCNAPLDSRGAMRTNKEHVLPTRPSPAVPPSVLESLRAEVRQIEGRRRRATAALPFGVAKVDARLPGGGLARNALHEIAGGGNGAIDGAAAALFAAGIAARTKGKILWCITRQDLFAPALAQVGLGSDRVIYVDACDEKSVLACFEEGVRHGGLGAVVAEVARLSMTSSRRLSLAAETSGSMAIAIR